MFVGLGQQKAHKKQPEYELQVAVTKFISWQWPSVFFLSDVKAAVKLTIPQQVRLKKIQKEGFNCPDLIIFEARRGYNGMFLELKAESPFKKDGKLKSSEHLQYQQNTILALGKRGYHAAFYWDFETIKTEINWYLGE